MLNKNKYTLSQVENIIDSHIENSTNFLMVTNFALAHCICDYLNDTYGIEAEVLELSTEVDEYYLSLSFYGNSDIKFFCEFASWNQGKYKYDDVENNNYYIFTDMPFGETREYLKGEGDLQFCELVDDEVELATGDDDSNDSQYDVYDVCDECKNCIGCDEHCGRGNRDEEYIEDCEDEELENNCDEFCTCEYCTEEREQAVITEFLDMLFDPEGACKNCIIEKFIDSLYTFKDFGVREVKEEMKEFLED